MIRVNLLPEAKAGGITRAEALPAAGAENLNTIVMVVFIALGVLFTGWQWWRYHSEIKLLDTRISDAQRELERLKPIIEEVEQFKRRKAILEKKLNLINQLKANQQGPVHIMDEMSNCIPELLWLDNMTLKGNTIQLMGKAFNTNAISELIENLYNNPYFGEPTLREVREQKNYYGFSMSFPFTYVPKKGEKQEETHGSHS